MTKINFEQKKAPINDIYRKLYEIKNDRPWIDFILIKIIYRFVFFCSYFFSFSVSSFGIWLYIIFFDICLINIIVNGVSVCTNWLALPLNMFRLMCRARTHWLTQLLKAINDKTLFSFAWLLLALSIDTTLNGLAKEWTGLLQLWSYRKVTF